MGKVLYAEADGQSVLRLEGDVRLSLGPTMASFIDHIHADGEQRRIIIDLRDTECIDSTALGLLAKLSLRCQEAFKTLPLIVSTNPDITRVLESMGFEQVFVIVTTLDLDELELGELPTRLISEEALAEQVLDAHRVLMSLNEENHAAFKDLVAALEAEQDSATNTSSRLKASR